MQVVHAEFEVDMKPVALDGPAEDAGMARWGLEKVYRGAMDGTGTGQMLSAGDPSTGSAGYVAVERFEGRLKASGGELAGSFLLQHSGIMSPEGEELTVAIVPGSGTGALMGIAGALRILVDGAKHSCELEFSLPD